MSDAPAPVEQYRAAFAGTVEADTKRAKAHALALDVRKFEIELYWRRAAYFWAFTGAALAGYLTVLTGKDIANKSDALLLVSCLGLVFSVAWYFVNRASKFWQANWEAHVDLLEDPVVGPIYKTVLQDKSPFWRIDASYPFSVTKINQLLSFFVVLVFAGLVAETLRAQYELSRHWQWFPTGCVLLTSAAIALLFLRGRTGQKDSQKDRVVDLRRRNTSVTDYRDG
jgi:hypothetical protein